MHWSEWNWMEQSTKCFLKTINNLVMSSSFWSPYGRRQLQLEPLTPHWSTQTHTSTFPFHGPRGGGGQGIPPACLGTPSKPAVRQTGVLENVAASFITSRAILKQNVLHNNVQSVCLQWCEPGQSCYKPVRQRAPPFSLQFQAISLKLGAISSNCR